MVTTDETITPLENNLKVSTVQYVSLSDVFSGNPDAFRAFEDSGDFSYGDNDITLVKRDTLLNTMKRVKGFTDVIEKLDPKTYIDLES